MIMSNVLLHMTHKCLANLSKAVHCNTCCTLMQHPNVTATHNPTPLLTRPPLCPAAFKESLIPRAVEWFTGEISPPMFDDEFEMGEDDDDDFEEPPRRR
jgi:hypothetical protein